MSNNISSGVTIKVNGQTLVVAFAAGSATPTLYTDAATSSTTTLPATITSDTTWFVRHSAAPFSLSVKSGGTNGKELGPYMITPSNSMFVTYEPKPPTGAFAAPLTNDRPTVTGSKGANAALTSLMAALANLGLVTDSTS